MRAGYASSSGARIIPRQKEAPSALTSRGLSSLRILRGARLFQFARVKPGLGCPQPPRIAILTHVMLIFTLPELKLWTFPPNNSARNFPENSGAFIQLCGAMGFQSFDRRCLYRAALGRGVASPVCLAG